jgi:Na+/glutamate symporter
MRVQSLKRQAMRMAALVIFTLLTGCARAPSFNILGSFFPAWLICMIVGIVLATIARWVFARYSVENEIPWKIIVYPCLAFFFAFTLWLVFFY